MPRLYYILTCADVSEATPFEGYSGNKHGVFLRRAGVMTVHVKDDKALNGWRAEITPVEYDRLKFDIYGERSHRLRRPCVVPTAFMEEESGEAEKLKSEIKKDAPPAKKQVSVKAQGSQTVKRDSHTVSIEGSTPSPVTTDAESGDAEKLKVESEESAKQAAKAKAESGDNAQAISPPAKPKLTADGKKKNY